MNSGGKEKEFIPNDHLSPEVIKWYVAGQLSGKQMHFVEKHCLDCALCSDALDGYTSLGEAPAIESMLAELNGAVDKRIDTTQTNLRSIGWKTWGVAASVAAIFVYSVFFFKQNVDKATKSETIAIQPSTDSSLLPNEHTPSDGYIASELAPTDSSARYAQSLWRSPSPVVQSPQIELADKHPPILERENAPVVSNESEANENDAYDFHSEVPIVAPTVPFKSKDNKRLKSIEPDSTAASQTRIAAAKPSTAPNASSAFVNEPTISGKVISSEDGTALAGLAVTVKGTNQSTTTDSEGNYHVKAPVGSTLVFNFIGMIPKEIPVNAPQTPLDVAMQPDLQALSEVVVVGYGSQKIDSLKAEKVYTVETQPINGFNEYKNYLSGNLRYPVEARQKGIAGSVTVEFFVEPDGSLTNFRVLKSPGFGCDDEAIRLIKEGPKWKPGQKGNNLIRQRVKVKVKCRS